MAARSRNPPTLDQFMGKYWMINKTSSFHLANLASYQVRTFKPKNSIPSPFEQVQIFRDSKSARPQPRQQQSRPLSRPPAPTSDGKGPNANARKRQLGHILGILEQNRETKTLHINGASGQPTRPSSVSSNTNKQPTQRFSVNEIRLTQETYYNGTASLNIRETTQQDHWELTSEDGLVADIDTSVLRSIKVFVAHKQITIVFSRPLQFNVHKKSLTAKQVHLTFKDDFTATCDHFKRTYPRICEGLSGSNDRLKGLEQTQFRKRPSMGEAPIERVRRVKLSSEKAEDLGERISRKSLAKVASLPSKPLGPPLGTPLQTTSGPRFPIPTKPPALSSHQPFQDPSATLRRAVKEQTLTPSDRIKRDLFANQVAPVKAKQPEPPTYKPTPRPLKDEFTSTYKFIFKDQKIMDVTPDDFRRLDEGEFLNDTLINFYLKYFHQISANENKALGDSIYIFNTFFYDRLSYKSIKEDITKPEDQDIPESSNYDKVKKWTSKVDLFKMKYVFVPINAKLHWNLALIYNLPALLRSPATPPPQESAGNAGTREINLKDDCVIFVLDSLRTRNYTGLGGKLSEYIAAEAADKLGVTVDKRRIVTKRVDTPQQTNFCDCGVYLIHYVHQFLSYPEEFVELMAGDGEKNNQKLQRKWEARLLQTKRGVLKRRIVDFRKESEENKLEVKSASPLAAQPANAEAKKPVEKQAPSKNGSQASRQGLSDIDGAIQLLDSHIEETDKNASAEQPSKSQSLQVSQSKTSSTSPGTAASATAKPAAASPQNARRPHTPTSNKSDSSKSPGSGRTSNGQAARSPRPLLHGPGVSLSSLSSSTSLAKKSSKESRQSRPLSTPSSPARSRRRPEETESAAAIVVEDGDDDDDDDDDDDGNDDKNYGASEEEVEVVKEQRAKRHPKPVASRSE